MRAKLMRTQTGRHGWLQNFPRGRNKILDCGVGAGCGANNPMNNLIIGVVAQPIRSGRATSDLHGNRRATLTHGFIKNTIGRPAYSFPSDSSARMDGTVAGAKHECFLSHCSTPKRGWWANTALQRTGLGFLASDRLGCFMFCFPFVTLARATARSLSLGR